MKNMILLLVLIFPMSCVASNEVESIQQKCDELGKGDGKEYIGISGKVKKHFVMSRMVLSCDRLIGNSENDSNRHYYQKLKERCNNPQIFYWVFMEVANPPFPSSDDGIPVIFDGYVSDTETIKNYFPKDEQIDLCGVEVHPGAEGDLFAIPVVRSKISLLQKIDN